MNFINKILILAIVLFLINHLTNGQIYQTIRRYIDICQEKVENFTGLNLSDFKINKYNESCDYFDKTQNLPYLNSNDINNFDDETYAFYRFINNMVTPNINTYDLSSHRTKKIESDIKFNEEILNHINKIFNSKGYKFNNIKLVDNLFYYENPIGKDIEQFNFTADVTHREKNLGHVLINIESFLREDKIFYSPMKTGFLSIHNIRLLNIKYPENKEIIPKSGYKFNQHNQPKPNSPKHVESKIKNFDTTKTEQKAIIHTKNLADKMNEQFTEHFVDREDYDDLFIKPDNKFKTDGFINDTDNSLIPSIINISTYERDSTLETS